MRGTVLLLSFLVLVTPRLFAQDPPSPLPSLREIWLDTKELPSDLGSGSWSIVPRAEFSSTHQRARAMADALRRPPWLVNAHYEARFTPHLLRGTARLSLHNPHAVPALARLSPWSLTPTVSQTGLQGLAERTLGIEVPPGGTATRTIDWSVQGEQRGDGTWFQLTLPPCSQAMLELVLPFPYRLDWPGGREHLSGPFAVPGSSDRLWRLTLGGAGGAAVQLVVRAGAAASPGWTEARLDADFIVTPGSMDVRYECDLQRWQGRLTTMIVDLPPGFVTKTIALRQAGVDAPLSWQPTAPGVAQVSFPESVEQRAVLVITGTLPVSAGRFRFDLPHCRGIQALRPTLRIVTPTSAPLVDWQWGDFSPAHVPEGSVGREQAVELMTLTQQRVTALPRPQSASARMSLRKEALTSTQDTWAHWTPAGWRVTVRCQATMQQGQVEHLTWNVPAGWEVQDVTLTGARALRAWARQPNGPLIVEPRAPWHTGQSAVCTITLQETTATTLSPQPRRWQLPHLAPRIPGQFTGLYAVTFSRQGKLLPPSVTVVQPPGPDAYPPLDRQPLWPAVPDFCWQLAKPEGGALLLHDWAPTYRAEVRIQATGPDRVRWRVRVEPLAGSVTSMPLEYFDALSPLQWQVVGQTSPPVRWESTSDRSGVLHWATPLDRPVELECSVPWRPDLPLPLLTCPRANHLLDLPPQYRPVAGHGLVADPSAGVEALWTCWRLLPTSRSILLQSTLPEHAGPQQVRLSAQVHGERVDCEFRCVIPARRCPLTLSVPTGAVLLEAWVDDQSHPLTNELLIPSRPELTRVLWRYRLPVHRNWGLSSVAGVTPRADGETVPVDDQVSWRLPVGVFVASGTESSTDTGVWWIERDILVSLGLLSLIVLVLNGKLLARFSTWAASLFGRKPVQVTAGLVLLTLPVGLGAQDERDVALVYVIPGERRQDDRVVLPTPLWNQLRTLAQQDVAGSPGRLVVESVQSTGELAAQRLRLTSTWTVQVRGEGPVDLPWPGPLAVHNVLLNGEPFQPRLASGPFGLQQLSFRLPGPGRHTLRLTYDLPARRSQAISSIDLPWPGAPRQTLHVSVPEKLPGLSLTGVGGLRAGTVGGANFEAEVGLARKVALSWLTPHSRAPEVEAQVGVLWEHRVPLSVAHALVRYQIEHGAVEALELDIPSGVRVRNVSLIGEVNAPVIPRLESWNARQQGTVQRLTIQLQRPVSGIVHLLLELPWDRQSAAGGVPLAGVRPLGASLSGGFTAYLVDGVHAELTQRLTPVAVQHLTFARAWLPSLVLLPPAALTELTPPDEAARQISLRPAAPDLQFHTRMEIHLDEKDVKYQYPLNLVASGDLPAFLSAEVDAGLHVREVQGAPVLRWHLTPAVAGQSSRLEVWLKGRSTTKAIALTVVAQPTLPAGDPLTLPLPRLHWNLASAAPTPLAVFSTRLGLVESIHAPAKVLGLVGPWPQPDLVAAYNLPSGPATDPLQIKLRRSEGLPHALAERTTVANVDQWTLTLTAHGFTTLPARLDLVAPGGQLVDGWSFTADVPLAAIPRKDDPQRLAWSVAFAKPATKLTVRYTSRDGQPNPSVTLPQFPGLTWKHANP